MFYSPKDVHKASSDLSGTGFDSKSSNHKQWSHYSYDSSDLPAEKKSTLFLELQHLLYLIINLVALVQSPMCFIFIYYSVALAYWKHSAVKVN